MERTGKELLLATKPFAKENIFLSWYHMLSTYFLFLLFMAGTIWNVHPIGKVICSLLTGFTAVRLFVIYHDHQHHSILYKSKAADFILSIFGMYMLAPKSIWKRSHDYHHNHNSKLFSASIGSFPIMTKEKFLNASPEDRKFYLAVRSPLNIIFGFYSMFIYGMCIQSFLSSPRRHYDSLIALISYVTIGVLITYFIGWHALILTWLLPSTLSCGLGAYLFYAQHNFPAATFKNNVEWSYEHAALESSSFMKLSPFLRWSTANIGYHHIHHINSRIPFYRLPEAMASIPELQHPQETSLKLREVIRCLRLKVWDPEQNRMLTLKEIW